MKADILVGGERLCPSEVSFKTLHGVGWEGLGGVAFEQTNPTPGSLEQAGSQGDGEK